MAGPTVPSEGTSASTLCGFLVLDKPQGLTSHDCVNRVRRAYGLRRVGHGGTLDPAVTGVLPIAVGPATRLLPYLSGGKGYRGVIQLGLRTSSDDLQGEVLDRQAVPALDEAQLDAALALFRGEILQKPPQVSAVHVRGERAHARARRGETMELPARPVHVNALQLIGWDSAAGRLEVTLACSAGTYVRSLARDLGEALGCGGTLAALQRTSALGFELAQAIPLEALDPHQPPALRDPLEALGHLSRHRMGPEQVPHWRCGRPLAVDAAPRQPVAVLNPDGRLAGMAQGDGQGLLLPRLVLDAAG
jgi:tRNA pseudouridine55 synthase